MFGKFGEQMGPTAETSSVLPSPHFTPAGDPAQFPNSKGTVSPRRDIRANEDIDSSVTSTISALISAILALVVILLAIFIVQAIKRRRRERQGAQFGQPIVHAIAPPAFAPTTAAYVSRSTLSSRYLVWENVSQSTAPILHPIQQDEHQHHSTDSPNTPSSISTGLSLPSTSLSSNALSSIPSSSCS